MAWLPGIFSGMVWIAGFLLGWLNLGVNFPIQTGPAGAVATPSQVGASKRTVAKIHYGDILHLFVYNQPEVTGDFIVQDDGAIYIPRIDGVDVLGVTVSEARKRVLKALEAVYKKPVVALGLKVQAEQKVYVYGGTRPPGTVPLTPTTDLRKVVAEAGSEKDVDPDLVDVSVFRSGNLLEKLTEQHLLDDAKAWNGPLEANDVVVIQPSPRVRVWISGLVKNPGRTAVPVGSDVYQALAAAGDIVVDQPLVRDEVRITIRRGVQEIVVPPIAQAGYEAPKLEPGDTILVQPPTRKRVYVSGEVRLPSDYLLPGNATVFDAITKAGGLTGDGSFGAVFVMHNGFFKLYNGTPDSQREELGRVPLASDDSVFVPVNRRVVYVLGEVKVPGRYALEDDHKAYHLAEVIARAGGLSSTGTLRRVTIVRYSADGKATATRYNLDEFLKDGKTDSNPEIKVGDFVFVGTPKGLTLGDVANGLSTVLIVDTIFRTH